MRTGQYFQSLEKWTSNPDEAHDFRRLSRAMKFAVKAGFTDMELIVALDESVDLQAVMS